MEIPDQRGLGLDPLWNGKRGIACGCVPPTILCGGYSERRGWVSRFLETGLVEGLRDAATTGKPALLTSALAVPSGTGTGPASVGLSRARDLAVNVVLPFLHAVAEIRQDSQETEAYLETYGRFGKLQDNELTREMSEQLFDPGWGEVVNNARRQQGLLHLKHLISGLG